MLGAANSKKRKLSISVITSLPIEVLVTDSKRKGSVFGHRIIQRDLESGHNRSFKDYLAENPVYQESIFRRRFRMSKVLFSRIEHDISAHDSYFQQKPNAAGKMGATASSIQKMTAALALRMLAHFMRILKFLLLNENFVHSFKESFPCHTCIYVNRIVNYKPPSPGNIHKFFLIEKSEVVLLKHCEDDSFLLDKKKKFAWENLGNSQE